MKVPTREGEEMMTGKNKTVMYGLIFAVAVLAGGALVYGEEILEKLLDSPDDMVFEWTAPTTGSAVDKYEVEIRTGGVNSTDVETRMVTTKQVTFAVDWLTLYEVRVRGIDSAGRVGPWSIWSLAEDRDHDEPSF